MKKEFELWQFVYDRLIRDENVMLLVVAESWGSSPGRAGYKMAVAADGELCGSIGGGVMEVNLVERCRDKLSVPPSAAGGALLIDQVHQKNSPDASGMICSGRQTVIFKLLRPADEAIVNALIHRAAARSGTFLRITPAEFRIHDAFKHADVRFEMQSDPDFVYEERLGPKNFLFIIGGGHCSLALSELMSNLDFRVTILDDRPELNTIGKNVFADEIAFIDDYANVADRIADDDSYVVVMTLGYSSDKVVIKALADRGFKYFGVLGSKAKMATLMKELESEGVSREQLDRICTPIGIPINSRTPEEIAVSIAAEIISVKNGVAAISPRSPKEVRNT